jgi:hypothetical protein
MLLFANSRPEIIALLVLSKALQGNETKYSYNYAGDTFHRNTHN